MNRNAKIPTSRAVLAVLALTALTAYAARAEEVDLRGDAAPDGLVTIENIAGSITVTGWDRNEIAVTGTVGRDVERIDFKTGSKSRIKVVYPKKAKQIRTGADLEIRVPRGSSLEIECISASVDVSGVTGEIEAATISGAVNVTGPCESIEAESISGEVVFEGDAAEVELESVSGRLKARGGRAEVEAQSVSGRIDLVFDLFEELSVGSVSGHADVEGALARGASVEVELHSGTLTLTLPADVSASFEIETFSGNIDDAFGHEARRTSKYAPGKELEFEVGGGDARVKISTFSGNVRIRKK